MNKTPALVLCLALLSSAPLARAQRATTTPATPAAPALKLGTGFDYSSGDYGFSRDTEVFSVPVNLSYETHDWAFRASLPFLTIKGPAAIVAGSGTESPSTGTAGAPGRPVSSSQAGLGDLLVSGTYHANPVPGELNLDFTGRVKFPTADKNKGLGTGETDFYAQTDLYQAFGSVIPFVSLGYRFLGSNTTYPLKDGPYATAGVSFRTNATTVIGGALDWRSKIIAGAQNAMDALVFLSTNPNERWNLLGYLLAGFNKAAPNYGLGAQVTYQF